MKHILVTGGAGFIGSNFVRTLLNKTSYTVVVLDALTYAGSLDSIQAVLGHRCLFVHGDITDAGLIEQLFLTHAFDGVVNLAAESHVDRSIEDASTFIRSNVLGVQVLLEACRKHNIQKYVQVSTDEVYGSLGNTGLFTEKSPLNPSSPYSASKASADMLVQAWHHTYSLPVNITRCSNNYGPYQHPEKLIPLMISKALANEPLPVYGDGSNIRDWIHVQDHCEALLCVLQHGAPGRVYNIGGQSELNNLDVVNSILSMLQKPKTLIAFVDDRLGHDWRYAIDNSRITAEMDWKPSYTFSEGLEQTVEWYLTHEAWLRLRL